MVVHAFEDCHTLSGLLTQINKRAKKPIQLDSESLMRQMEKNQIQDYRLPDHYECKITLVQVAPFIW